MPAARIGLNTGKLVFVCMQVLQHFLNINIEKTNNFIRRVAKTMGFSLMFLWYNEIIGFLMIFHGKQNDSIRLSQNS